MALRDGTYVKCMPLPVHLVPKTDLAGLGYSLGIFLISVTLADPTD